MEENMAVEVYEKEVGGIDYAQTYAITSTIQLGANTSQIQFQIPSNVIRPDLLQIQFTLNASAACGNDVLALLHTECIPFFDQGLVNMDGQQLLYIPILPYANKLLGRCFKNEIWSKYSNSVFFRKKESRKQNVYLAVLDNEAGPLLGARQTTTWDIPHLINLYGRAWTQASVNGNLSVVKNYGLPTFGFCQYDPMDQTRAAAAAGPFSQIAFDVKIPLNQLFPQSVFDLQRLYIRDTLEIRLQVNPITKILCQLSTANTEVAWGDNTSGFQSNSNVFHSVAAAAYADNATFTMDNICVMVPYYRKLTREDVPKTQAFGYNDVRYAVRTNDVIRFTGGVPGAKLNWQLLSFFTAAGTGGDVYNNANYIYNGVNDRITNLQINIDGQMRLPQVESTSFIYNATWINNISNNINIDFYEWQYQNHFWFFDYRSGHLNGKDCISKDCSIEFNGTFHATPLYVLVSNFTKILQYDSNYQISVL